VPHRAAVDTDAVRNSTRNLRSVAREHADPEHEDRDIGRSTDLVHHQLQASEALVARRRHQGQNASLGMAIVEVFS
jgi:hypothetical protein